MPAITVNTASSGEWIPVTIPVGMGDDGVLTVWMDFNVFTQAANMRVYVDRGTPDQQLQFVFSPASSPAADNESADYRALVLLNRPGSTLEVEVRSFNADTILVGYDTSTDVAFSTGWNLSDQFFPGDEYPGNDPRDWYGLGQISSTDLENEATKGVSAGAGEFHEYVGEDVSEMPTLRALADAGEGWTDSASHVGYNTQYYSDPNPPPTSHSFVGGGYMGATMYVEARHPEDVPTSRAFPIAWHQESNGLADYYGFDEPLQASGIYEVSRQTLRIEWEDTNAPDPFDADIRYRFSLGYEMRTLSFGIVGPGTPVDHPIDMDLQVRDISTLGGGFDYDTYYGPIDQLGDSWHTPASLSTNPLIESRNIPSGAGDMPDDTWNVVTNGLDLDDENSASILLITSLQADNIEPPWETIRANVAATPGAEIIKSPMFYVDPYSLQMQVGLTYPRYRLTIFTPAPIVPLLLKAPSLRQYPRNDGRKGGARSARPSSRQDSLNRVGYL